MLVLSRKQREWVDINGGFRDGGVSICITRIGPNEVRLGIEAHPDVPIHRREIMDKIRRANDNEGPKP